jgi:hypothetical protein
MSRRYPTMTKRPPEVIVIAVLLFAAAAISTVVSFSLFVPGTALDRMWNLNPAAHEAFAAQAGHTATILLLAGVLAAVAGAGLLRGRLWAWLLSIALFGVNALGVVVSLLVTRDWPRSLAGILIDALLLFLLLRAKVRAFFLNRA